MKWVVSIDPRRLSSQDHTQSPPLAALPDEFTAPKTATGQGKRPWPFMERATRFELATLTLAKWHGCSCDLGFHPFPLVRGRFKQQALHLSAPS